MNTLSITKKYTTILRTASSFLLLLSITASTQMYTKDYPIAITDSRETVETYLGDLYTTHADLMADPITFAEHFAQTLNEYNVGAFWIGASSSGYQFEGGNDATSAAAHHYRNNDLEPADVAIDFWNRYTTDIPQMKQELGITHHRISLSWSRIEPQEGMIDYEALAHYADIMKTYALHGITPLVNFHHYDEPLWFKEKGGFVNDKNRAYFVRFVKTVYDYLHDDIYCISLCNSVEGAAFKAYYTGDLFPGEKKNMQAAHECMANMDIAILEGALEIRKLHRSYTRQGKTVKKPFIITQINILLFDPSDKTTLHRLCHYLSKPFCKLANKTQTGGTFALLTTGTYSMYIPGMVSLSKEYKHYPQLFAYAFDAIGINHYSNNFMFGPQRIKETDPERQTESHNYRNYPEGLYRAIQHVHNELALPLGRIKYKGKNCPMPIIITENGIAAKNDILGNKTRETYFQRTLFTILQAIKDGYHVIGYLPWASHDNYEWPSKDTPEQKPFGHRCYGFFHVDIDPASPTYLTRTLKTGSYYFANFTQTLARLV